ncbi:hypothetical protein VIMS_01330 [Mycobacterium marinum]|nr:hypothetical protein VIMS_01330 [Mycobacterium marinum]
MIDMMISRITTVKPVGRQSRLNERMNSTTTRAMSSSQKMNSANPRIWKNSTNESLTLPIRIRGRRPCGRQAQAYRPAQRHTSHRFTAAGPDERTARQAELRPAGLNSSRFVYW